MKPRPTIVWGSVSALLAAAAFAQQPGSQPATDPSSQAYSLTNSVDTREMLSDLAGIFRLDLRINPNQWYGNTAMLNPDGSAPSTGQVGDQTSQSAAGANATTGNAGSNTPRAINNQPQPGQAPVATRDPSIQRGDIAGSGQLNSSSALNGAVSVRGYSEKRWTLGGNILQETTIVPDLAAVVSDINDAQAGNSDQTNTNGRNAANMPGGSGAENAATGESDDVDAGFGRPSMEALEANRMFQGVSYLSFNPQTNALTLTSMDSRQSDVLNATGQFLPGMNRVEFTVNRSNSNMLGNQSGNAANTSNPAAANEPNNFNAQTDPNRPGANTPGTTGNTNNTSNPNTNANRGGNQANPPNQPTGNNNNNNANARNNNANTNATNQPTDPNRLQQTRDQNTANGSNSNSLNASADAFDNVRVVLELVSPDQHRVTLYRLNPGANGDQYQNPYYVPQNSGIVDASGRTVDAQGRVVDAQDRLLDSQGRLVDAQGRLIDSQGRVVDSQGRVLDADGRPIDPNNNADPNAPRSNPAGDPNDPNTRQPQPGDPSRPASNVPTDPSRPRVTGAAPATSTGQPPNTVTDAPGARPNNTNDPNSFNQPNNNNQAGQPNRGNQPGSTGTFNTPGNAPDQMNNQPFNQNFPGNISAGDQGTWVVIWEATYTRVDGAEASRYRSFLQRADQLIQASVREDNDR